mgnify:CR=1 FL=1
MEGIPILFIPGSAGSFRQVRSLASEAAKKQYSNPKNERFHFFTVNFNEEFTGFHGASILQQAEYLNGVVNYILPFYSKCGKNFLFFFFFFFREISH